MISDCQLGEDWKVRDISVSPLHVSSSKRDFEINRIGFLDKIDHRLTFIAEGCYTCSRKELNVTAAAITFVIVVTFQ